MTRLPTKSELDSFLTYLETVPIDPNFQPDEYGYDSSVLICMDAVLSINRKYNGFVVPRIEAFRTNHGDINTLARLVNKIHDVGYEGFCEVWNYQHLARVELLERVSLKYLNYAYEIGENKDLRAMRHWAENSSVEGSQTFDVKGIGLATYQYLRMLLGVSTVKPDTHIIHACELALGRRVSPVEAIWIVEKASERLGMPAIKVDHSIWKYYASS